MTTSSPFYGSPSYTRHLSAAGQSTCVKSWNAHVIERNIGRGDRRDAAGAYPLFSVPDTISVSKGLEELADLRMVSFTGVLDPISNSDDVRNAFPVCRPFKTHYVIEHPALHFNPSKHHRHEIRRALSRCTIDIGPLHPWLVQWDELYSATVAQRDWSHLHRFSMAHWQDIAADHRLKAIRANTDGELMAMGLFIEDSSRVYYHLAASTALGRRIGASYAVLSAAVEHFAAAEVINLGGAAGLDNDLMDGLARFKSGFANATRLASLVGAILDEPVYARLSSGIETGYFPAYREPSEMLICSALQSFR